MEPEQQKKISNECKKILTGSTELKGLGVYSQLSALCDKLIPKSKIDPDIRSDSIISLYTGSSKNMDVDYDNYNNAMDIDIDLDKPGTFETLDELIESLEKMAMRGKKGPKKELTAEENALITVIKKYIGPIIQKSTLETRIRFWDILTKLLDGTESCLQFDKGRLALIKNGVPVVYFSSRIGSESKYGMVYMSTGRSYGRLLKFATKFTPVTKEAQTEVFLLREMSSMVTSKRFPNMPITYKIMNCTIPCKDPSAGTAGTTGTTGTDKNKFGCPEITKQDPYYVVINELADYDLSKWFSELRTDREIQSILMQMILSIHAFHSLGYIHNDTHFGNFLIHKIKPGGYWRYRINNNTIYVPNTGYLLVIWDPGLAKPINNVDSLVIDYARPLFLMYEVERHYKNTVGIDSQKSRFLIYEMYMYLKDRVISLTNFKDDVRMITDMILKIKMNIINFNYIKVDEVPNDYLLNIKPFTIATRVIKKRKSVAVPLLKRVGVVEQAQIQPQDQAEAQVEAPDQLRRTESPQEPTFEVGRRKKSKVL